MQKCLPNDIFENGMVKSSLKNEIESEMQKMQKLIYEKQFLDELPQQNRKVITSELEGYSDGETVTDESINKIIEGCAENIVRSLIDRNMLNI